MPTTRNKKEVLQNINGTFTVLEVDSRFMWLDTTYKEYKIFCWIIFYIYSWKVLN